MPTRVVDFHPLAARELRVAFRWYSRRNPMAAQRFRLALNRTINRIETAAELGVKYRQLFRWMRVHRFPYVLYFEIQDPGFVLVYAVAHARRRPGYWLRRTSTP